MDATRTLPPVRACLFDMDGLLINSEDIYTLCLNLLLAEYSAGPMTWDIKSQLQGLPASEATKLLLAWFNLSNIDQAEYTRKLTLIQAEQFKKSQPLPGVERLLGDLKNARTATGGKLRTALATSSRQAQFKMKTEHLGRLFDFFEPKSIVLGDDPRIPPGKGKPWPDIYLVALQTINDSLDDGEQKIKPEECLVFEDGIPGVVAGRRAAMRVVWVPHPGLAKEYKGREAKVLAGIVENDADETISGVIGDGLGEQLVSLENFPYERYGIKV